MTNYITLHEAWNLLDSLNDDANCKVTSFWNSLDWQQAMLNQSFHFKNNFLNLDDFQKQSIIFWIKHDDEFKDYFECLSGEDFINNLL